MTITHSYDADDFCWRLYVSAPGQSAPMPAGERLFRAQPHPEIEFTHDSEAGAARDAARLREYLGRVGERKGKRSKSGA